MNDTAKTGISYVNGPKGYGIVSKAFHWLIAALVIVQCILGIYAHSLPVSLERLIVLARHKSVGMTIFALMLPRVAWILYSPPPKMPPSNYYILHSLGARIGHLLFYALLLSLPIVGWLSSSASNLTVSWFGLFSLPNLIGPDKHLAHWLVFTHQTLAWMLIVLIIIHILAALWHQLIAKDDVMFRMLPFKKPNHTQGNQE